MRYTLLMNGEGGIIDDLMVTRLNADPDDGVLAVVVNAGRKDADYVHLRAQLSPAVTLEIADDRALLALQGPKAAEVMARHCPEALGLAFMSATSADFDGMDCVISRSGYTGEDGFEISMPANMAAAFAAALLAEPEVLPIGLGARDSLRLEAGLCLYGHDIDETTSPIEADLAFAVAKRRRVDADFPGAERVDRELYDGPVRRRVGLALEGKAPARDGSEIRDLLGDVIGTVTSGGYGPTVGGPIAMGYVTRDAARAGTRVLVTVRGKNLPATVISLPFVPHRYFREDRRLRGSS